MSTPEQGSRPETPPSDAVRERAELLPEELAAGSDDPRAQAEEILEDSIERTEQPDPDASTQSGRRRSEDTL
jgi:hypothetical protein